jgi:hypothetical protein
MGNKIKSSCTSYQFDDDYHKIIAYKSTNIKWSDEFGNFAGKPIKFPHHDIFADRVENLRHLHARMMDLKMVQLAYAPPNNEGPLLNLSI